MEEAQVHHLRVSPAGPDGDGTLSVVPNAKGMSDEEMRELALSYGHISGFVFPTREGSDLDYEIRIWHPYYELEKCAHAMIGTVWLLSKLGMMPRDDLRIVTKIGRIEARITKTADNTDSTNDGIWVEFSNPTCSVMDNMDKKHADAILSGLDISRDDIVPGAAIQNAGTNKMVKTLVPIESIAKLHDLEVEYNLVKKLLGKIKSNGLCLYAIANHERQDGHWEDTATALAFGMLINELVDNPHGTLKIRQVWNQDRHREISLRFRKWGSSVDGCWIGGTAKFETEKRETGKTGTWETDTE
ncbi:hypothetical protein N7471_011301 [Penicillium samsonianum]|uniref:uncharacterized protein n=1 Tax=Penicillium samsonianum TaxID=1882272 RepID=UPI002546CD27|nr:uncharacterized protein N7471_011301 [Penicillium samsonianum]KAJ6123984.1 hypothetical protein N7471_011301 [Penicillium samsonianum]